MPNQTIPLAKESRWDNKRQTNLEVKVYSKFPQTALSNVPVLSGKLRRKIRREIFQARLKFS